VEDFSRGTERRCADQLVTELADPAKSNPLNFSISHPSPSGREVAVNEVYRPLMRIDVNSLSASLRGIISRLVIVGSRYEKIERKVHTFMLKLDGEQGEGGNGVESPRIRHSRPRNR